jgi:hypothetical protein
MKYKLISAVTVLFALLSFSSNANLALSEYRLLFDNKTKTNSLLLRNTSDNTMTFSIEITHQNMTKEGNLMPISEAQMLGHSAKKMLRYSPRRGKIKPRGVQAVRFNVRKPANIANGEYRSVLRIVSQMQKTNINDSLSVTPKIAYSIPIIIRHGQVFAEAQLKSPNLVMQNGHPTMQFTIASEGNRSLFGNAYIVDSKNNEIGRIDNIALYPPLKERLVYIPLVSATKGEVTIHFDEQIKYGGNISLQRKFSLE